VQGVRTLKIICGVEVARRCSGRIQKNVDKGTSSMITVYFVIDLSDGSQATVLPHELILQT